MKIIYRILIILFVAVMVGGTLYSLVNITGAGSQAQINGRPAGLTAQAQFNAGPGAQRSDGASWFSLPRAALKNLTIIAAISVLYLNFGKWIRAGAPRIQHR